MSKIRRHNSDIAHIYMYILYYAIPSTYMIYDSIMYLSMVIKFSIILSTSSIQLYLRDIVDPDPGSGCSDRILITAFQFIRIHPDPDPKHW